MNHRQLTNMMLGFGSSPSPLIDKWTRPKYPVWISYLRVCQSCIRQQHRQTWLSSVSGVCRLLHIPVMSLSTLPHSTVLVSSSRVFTIPPLCRTTSILRVCSDASLQWVHLRGYFHVFIWMLGSTNGYTGQNLHGKGRVAALSHQLL